MDFEVIEIIDDCNPYPMLLGIDWAMDINGVINLKRWKMILKKKVSTHSSSAGSSRRHALH